MNTYYSAFNNFRLSENGLQMNLACKAIAKNITYTVQDNSRDGE